MRLTKTTWILLVAGSLGGCLSDQGPAVIGAPTNAGVCNALGVAMPVQYHGKSTDTETITNIKRANAAYAAACP